jgi:hypothetical protein
MAEPALTLALGPTETPTIRCKTCKVPLPDATRKNCERCRRNRMETHNRWKRSVEARKNHGKNLIFLPTLETHPSSAPSSNVNIRWIRPGATSAATSQPPHRSYLGSGITPAHLPGAVTSTSTAPLDHERHHNRHRPASSQLPSDAPGLMSSPPHRINIPEYQWCEELVDALFALPPRSNFFGQFSVIADPDVDNSKRAQMFLDQLRSKGLPTSYVAAASFGFSSLEPHPLCLFSSFFAWVGKHRDLFLVTRMLPAGTRSVSTVDARLVVKAGSSSRSTTTPHTCTVCLVNASAWHFYTPPLDENLLWYSPSRTLLRDHTHTLCGSCTLPCSVLELHACACRLTTFPVLTPNRELFGSTIQYRGGPTNWTTFGQHFYRIRKCLELACIQYYCNLDVITFRVRSARLF